MNAMNQVNRINDSIKKLNQLKKSIRQHMRPDIDENARIFIDNEVGKFCREVDYLVDEKLNLDRWEFL